jgi:hypothetical protein
VVRNNRRAIHVVMIVGLLSFLFGCKRKQQAVPPPGLSSAAVPATAPATRATTGPGNVYADMRRMFLTAPSNPTFPAPPANDGVYGALLEFGLDKGSATFVAMHDGTTSMYTSTGGGYIGVGTHEPVRLANAAFVRAAVESSNLMTATNDFPLPAPGTIRFYLITARGVRTAEVSMAELKGGGRGLSRLADVGNDLVSQVRLHAERPADGE